MTDLGKGRPTISSVYIYTFIWKCLRGGDFGFYQNWPEYEKVPFGIYNSNCVSHATSERTIKIKSM